jgi:hypothetical protein
MGTKIFIHEGHEGHEEKKEKTSCALMYFVDKSGLVLFVDVRGHSRV